VCSECRNTSLWSNRVDLRCTGLKLRVDLRAPALKSPSKTFKELEMATFRDLVLLTLCALCELASMPLASTSLLRCGPDERWLLPIYDRSSSASLDRALRFLLTGPTFCKLGSSGRDEKAPPLPDLRDEPVDCRLRALLCKLRSLLLLLSNLDLWVVNGPCDIDFRLGPPGERLGMGAKPPPTVAALCLAVAGDGLGDASAETLGLFLLPLGDVRLVDFRGDSGELLDDFRRLAVPPESCAFSLPPTLGLDFRLGEGLAIIVSDDDIFDLTLEFDDALVSLILVDFRGALGEALLLLPLTASLALRVVGTGGDNR
jgi:hypothetical protein